MLADASLLHAALRGSYALDFLWWRLQLLTDPAVRRYQDVVRDAYLGETWTAQQQRLFAIGDAGREPLGRTSERGRARRDRGRDPPLPAH